MRQIEVINQETIIDVTAETSNVEILVRDYDSELVERFALEAQEAAIDAEESADIATAQASIATAQAGIATTQAGIATTQAGIATTQADIATTKANEASASAASALASEQAADADRILAQTAATTATTQAGIATTQAGIATTKAGEASASAASALASETDAETAASTATTQAGIATTQAGIATTQAGNALTSANNAAASAASAASAALNTPLTGFTTGANSTILATDTTLQAFNKTQGQINARVSGTGASGQVAFWNGTSSQAGDTSFTWDNTTKTLRLKDSTDTYGSNIATVSFNTEISSPGSLFVNVGSNVLRGLQVIRSGNIVWNIGGSGNIVSSTSGAGTGASIYAGNTGAFGFQSVGSTLASNVIYLNNRVDNNNYGVRLAYRNAGTEATGLALQNNGNVLINTTTDAGFRLDVNGTARVQEEFTVGNGTDSIIRANSSVISSFQTTTLQASTANISTMLDIRPNGSSSSLTGFYLRDSSTAANGSNIVIVGRGNATLPSTGVTYLGALISGVPSANSLHLGFLVSNTSAGRIEAARIWNSGNVLIQAGGTYTDAGFRLDVNGSTRFNGLSTIQGTTASDSGQLGAELLTTGTGDASWTGTSFATGYTHVAGSTTTLTSTLAGVVNTFYQITYTVSGRTAGTFNIDFGGQTLGGLGSSSAQGVRATTTGTLVITPTSSFDGTIVLSIRVITASSASVTFNNSSGTVTNQIRISNSVSNTFFGLNAGSRNTTGINNTFIGSSTGSNNTSGNSNSFFGISAGRDNTFGSSNSFFGSSSGLLNTTGIFNSFFGQGSGQSNTTGNDNSFFGRASGITNTTGNSNSFFGASSGNSNTSGTANSFFGQASGFSNTTGGSNSFFGQNAGFNISSGSQNTLIGLNAGRFTGTGTTAMTSIDNSIYLGYQTRGLNATGSTNEIVIGINVVGLGSNTTVLGNTSTTHGRWYGSLLLGTTTNAASSILTIESTTQGVLFPRMTTTQKNAIASPATGLVVYDTTLNKLAVYTGAAWETITSV